MKFQLKNAVLALACAGTLTMAHATPLVLDAITVNVDVVASNFGGTLLDWAITPISNSSYSGTARAAVYDTGTGLDFYYQFSNDASSRNGIERFTGYDFSSMNAEAMSIFQTASGFGIFTNGTENADYADRTSFGVIGISFVPNGHTKINPGTTSFIQIVRTNARAYTSGNFGMIDGIGDNAVGFAPTAVPEPETYAMLLAGLGLMGVIARRRNRTPS